MATNLDRQLWLNIIAVLLLMGGLILLVISSLIVLIRCALAPQAIVLEGRGAVAALWRSWRMVHPGGRCLVSLRCVCSWLAS